MLAVVFDLVPYTRKVDGDDMQDVDAEVQKRHVVVEHQTAQPVRVFLFVTLWQKDWLLCAWRVGGAFALVVGRRSQQTQLAKSAFDGRHVLVCPVGGFEIRRHIRTGCAEQIKKDK